MCRGCQKWATTTSHKSRAEEGKLDEDARGMMHKKKEKNPFPIKKYKCYDIILRHRCLWNSKNHLWVSTGKRSHKCIWYCFQDLLNVKAQVTLRPAARSDLQSSRRDRTPLVEEQKTLWCGMLKDSGQRDKTIGGLFSIRCVNVNSAENSSADCPSSAGCSKPLPASSV